MSNPITHGIDDRINHRLDPQNNDFDRSTEMYTLHEALAREHLRELHQDARRRALVGQLASAKRWRQLERRAHAATQRHAQRAERLAQVSAVAH